MASNEPLSGIMKEAYYSYKEWHIFLTMRMKYYREMIQRVEGRDVSMEYTSGSRSGVRSTSGVRSGGSTVLPPAASTSNVYDETVDDDDINYDDWSQSGVGAGSGLYDEEDEDDFLDVDYDAGWQQSSSGSDEGTSEDDEFEY